MSPICPTACILVFLCGTTSILRGGDADDPDPQHNDFLIIPDVRAGPITREWTPLRIEAAFGTLHCRKEVRDFSEAEEGEEAGLPPYTVYLLYPDTPDEVEIKIDSNGKALLARLRIKWGDVSRARRSPSEPVLAV